MTSAAEGLESGDPGDKPYKFTKARRPTTIHRLPTHTAELSNESVVKYILDLYRATAQDFMGLAYQAIVD